jgi:hypothetical protein
MIPNQIKFDMRYAVETLLRRIARSAWCLRCDEIVDWLRVSEAAVLAETNPRTMFKWIKSGRVHCLKTHQGELICANSIQRSQDVTQEFRIQM